MADIHHVDVEAHHRFARAVNTTVLVAPQSVVTALMDFYEGVKASNRPFVKEEHDRLLSELLLAIRTDLRVEPKDEASTFKFQLVGAPPKSLPNNRMPARNKVDARHG